MSIATTKLITTFVSTFLLCATCLLLLSVVFPYDTITVTAQGHIGRLGGRTPLLDQTIISQLTSFLVTASSNNLNSVTNVISAEKQLVAGTNYYLTVEATNQSGSKVCEKVKIYKPLPVQGVDQSYRLTSEEPIDCPASQ